MCPKWIALSFWDPFGVWRGPGRTKYSAGPCQCAVLLTEAVSYLALEIRESGSRTYIMIPKHSQQLQMPTNFPPTIYRLCLDCVAM